MSKSPDIRATDAIATSPGWQTAPPNYVCHLVNDCWSPDLHIT
ncbi:MAG: hypothetical protein AVDCRST_MAG75-474 [uncultured Propionibacteriaceae bacterium]|uniref:Uncharacterized protein n=1 Tax=uncultured Propionibacteriaceae bacterium TaxID=257457 RepID=A0A6J4N5B3_9ACTN|nr:MAG: hypothetical protein AVDCRST_MAG75-474 [uncultured Propionibacteriaceae bacterium]